MINCTNYWPANQIELKKGIQAYPPVYTRGVVGVGKATYIRMSASGVLRLSNKGKVSGKGKE